MPKGARTLQAFTGLSPSEELGGTPQWYVRIVGRGQNAQSGRAGFGSTI